MNEAKKTGYVWHEIYAWHDTSGYSGLFQASDSIQVYQHYEDPEAKRRIRNLWEVSGLLDEMQQIPAVEISEADLLRVHSPEYLAKVQALDGKFGMLDEETRVAKASVKIAKKAAGGAIAAVRAVINGEVKNAYALLRPAGHHATPNRGMGFCIYNNCAIAAEYAHAQLGVKKIAIVDWEVHHGNGTQACFWKNPDVLTISLHQDNLYPQGGGFIEEIGAGAGRGMNINIPLPAGSGDGAYAYAFQQIVLPAVKRFGAELIIVACGLDASIEDPLGRQMLHAESYHDLTQQLMTLSAEICDGHLVMMHEGGYNAITTPFLGLRIAETLSGITTGITDPALAAHQVTAGQALQAHQQASIDKMLAYFQQIESSPLHA